MLLQRLSVDVGDEGPNLYTLRIPPLRNCGGECSASCRVIIGCSSATRDAVPWPCPEKVANGLISGHTKVLELLNGQGRAEKDGLIIRRTVLAIRESADPVSIVLFVLFVLFVPQGSELPQVNPAISEPNTESQIGIADASVIPLLDNCL